MAASSAMITKLNGAEQQADKIIEEAKRNRKTLLNKARQAAQEELVAFSARQEAQYQATVAAKGHGEATDALTAQTTRELSEVEDDFAKNSGRTVGYVVEKVLDVPLAMSSTQKSALITESGKPMVVTFGPDPQRAKARHQTTEMEPPAAAAPKPKPAAAVAAPEPTEDKLRGASAVFSDADMAGMGGGWGGQTALITLKSLKATIGDKKMDPFVEIRYGGKALKSQVVKNGGREAVFDEALPEMSLTPDAELIFSVGDFDKKDGKVSKEPIGDTKPIKLEEVATNDDGIFEGSFELFREGREKATGKLFVKIEIS